MTVILLPLAFLLIFTGLKLLTGCNEKEGIFIRAVLIFTFLVLFSTEVLSLFNFFSFKGIAVFWGVFNFILILVITIKYKHREKEIFDFQLFRKI